MNIVLIGYRGTGKSSVGKTLAKRLERRFFDADAYLEEKAGRTISEIVADKGWPFFRALEKEVIRELSQHRDCVIATGGGAVLDEENVTALRQGGRFILLKAEIPTMVARIQGDGMSGQQRPDLRGGGLLEETEAVMAERAPVYEKVADHAIDTTHLSVHAVVEAVMKFL